MAETDFSERLSRLIKTVHPPDRGPYSYREIARGMNSLGYKGSSTTIYQLAKGMREDPGLLHIKGLAAFFGVPVDYFTADEVAEKIDDQVADVVLARDEGARNIALRTAGLPEPDRAAVTSLLDALERRRREDGGTAPGRRR